MRYFSFIIFGLLFFPAAAHADTFFIKDSLDALERQSIEADAIYSGMNSLFFVERAYYNSLPASSVAELRAAIEYLMGEFDNNMYFKMREVFGEEQSPGVNGDTKIRIVLHRMKEGVGGYVEEGEGRTMYINISDINDRALAPAYLAHEFQHLITFNEKNIKRGLQEEQWLNEARSEYAPTLLGYNDMYEGSYLKRRVEEFLAHPSDALLDWQGKSIDHASASIFMHYLVDQYGVSLLTQMMNAKSVGIASINEALTTFGYRESFEEVFRNWILAVYINGSVGGEEKFKYKRQSLSFGNLHILPTTLFRVYDNNSTGANFVIDNWSGQWHRFVPGGLGEETTLHIRLSSLQKEGLFFLFIVSDFFGGTEIKFWDSSKGSIFSVDGFGKRISSVVAAPIFAGANAKDTSLTTGFSFEGFLGNTFASRFAEGALVRVKGDPRVYIVKNSPRIGEAFTRWIQTPEVFSFYQHFTWNDIIEVKREFLAGFKESFLIRMAGDYKVYEVDKLGRKKWLDMTPSEFEKRGYKWEAVYEANEAEFHWFSDK